MELHETLAQQAFIARQKRRRRMVTICRILLLFILLALWEICARFDIINDFIFSSPSRIIPVSYTHLTLPTILLV